MIQLCSEDLVGLPKLGSGTFGTVYQKDDKIAYKIYHPTVANENGKYVQNPTLKLPKSRFDRLIQRSKKLHHTGGVLDVISLDGKFGGVVIPYSPGIRFNQIMNSPLRLRMDASYELVRNAKELSSHFIYPTDYKLNNILYEDGNVRIIDLDDKRTHVSSTYNPFYRAVSVNALNETILTFMKEYLRHPVPKSVDKALLREDGRYTTQYKGIEDYLNQKEREKDIVLLDSSSCIETLSHFPSDSSFVYVLDDAYLREEEYMRIIQFYKYLGIPIYDFVRKARVDSYPDIENVRKMVHVQDKNVVKVYKKD